MATSRKAPRSRPGLVKGPDGKTRWSAELLREQLTKYTANLIEYRDAAASRAAERRDGDPETLVKLHAVYEGEAQAYARALRLLSIMTLKEFGDDPNGEQRAELLDQMAANRAAGVPGGEA